MRILWDCRSVAEHMGGIGQATVGWLREFCRQKPRNWSLFGLFSAVCKPDRLFALVPELRRSAQIHFVGAGLVAPRFEQLRLPALLREHQVDLYFNTCFTLPAIKTTRFQVSVIHDIVFIDRPEWVNEDLRQYLRQGADLALRRADAVFTVSEFSRQRIQEMASERDWERANHIEILRPALAEGVKAAAKTPAPRSSKEMGMKEFFLYVGAIERKKGIDLLLDAYAELRKMIGSQAPDLVLAGGVGGQEFDLQEELNIRTLQAHVKYLGFVSEKDKHALLPRALAFVFPSRYEGFGIPPLEAMAFGTPVVATRTTSLPEVLGTAALFTEPDNPKDLADALRRIFEDRELQKDLMAKGKRQVEAYSWKKEIEKLIARFERLEKTA